MELFTGFNGGIPIDEDFFAQNISGKLDDDIATVLFPDDIERGLDYVKKKKNVLGRKSCAIKGLCKLTKWVEDHGLKRAAVTNSPRPNAELMIPTLGLTDFYHNHIIGDEFLGIKVGVAAGMPVIGLTTRNPKHMLMKANPTLVIENYEDPKL
uniref:Putative HAD-like domain-containing protein n=1 Tax=Helianthus annuus TaxID=4232 RepID=A0A251VCI3_HELAN